MKKKMMCVKAKQLKFPGKHKVKGNLFYFTVISVKL